MPASAEILSGLTAIADDLVPLAALWHLSFVVGLSALAFGWRPSRRVASTLLSALPLSVSVVAFIYGNAFNGAAFAILAAWLISGGGGTRALSHRSDPRLTRWIGAALLVFGGIYPHFLDARPLVSYAMAAPTGLVPCPTLAWLIGVTLLKRNLFSTRWAVALGTFGIFYGAFGVFRLGVWLDAGLIFGAAWLWRSIVTGALDAD